MNLFDIILTIIILRTVYVGINYFRYAGLNEVKTNAINIHTIYLNASFFIGLRSRCDSNNPEKVTLIAPFFYDLVDLFQINVICVQKLSFVNEYHVEVPPFYFLIIRFLAYDFFDFRPDTAVK